MGVEPWVLAIVLRPFFLLLLFAVAVIPLELALQRIWPEGPLKRILFDRTFRDRCPGRFMLVWLALMSAMVLALWIEGAFGKS